MATVADPVRVEPIAFPVVPTPPVPLRTHRRHAWTKWALAVGLVVLLAVVGELWRIHSQNAITYETVPLERGAVQASVTATGTLNAVVDVQVGSQVSGNIKALYADFNTKVTKGQLVALIDPEVFQTQVDQAQAALSSAQSAVLTAGAQVQKATSDLSGTVASEKSAEAVIAKDRATALNATNQWGRLDPLFKQGIISLQDEDAAKATMDADAAQVTADQSLIDASKQTIQSAQDQVGVTQAQLGSAKGQATQARAALAQAKINLTHTRITAPVDGTVIARRMDVGQTAAASFAAPTVFEIAQDLTKMQVDTNVDESDVGNIKVGQSASFTVDAYPAMTFQGQVSDVRKAPIITQNVVTYDVVITVANPDLRLFPGMTANARILTTKLDDTFKVPNAVLRLHPSAAVLKQVGLSASPAGKQQVYVSALKEEHSQISGESKTLRADFNEYKEQIETALSPDFENARKRYKQLADQRAKLEQADILYKRIKALRKRLDEPAPAAPPKPAVVEDDDTEVDQYISKSTLANFSKTVEDILNAWHFPNATNVYFDVLTRDLVIGGQPRGSRGAGFCAITYSAFITGLFEYCRSRSMPHPGFVVLDSPLIAYKEPTDENMQITGTDLKQRFYEHLQSFAGDQQIFIVDNTEPPVDFKAMATHFTKNPDIPRYGFFPPLQAPQGKI